MKANGTIDKYKARLVIKGFRQREDAHQMDVKMAFINGDLEEEIYMNQQEGFIAPGQESKESSSGYVILCLYVGDMLITGTNDKMIKSTKDMLKSKFDMKDMGLADVILGIKIMQTQNRLVTPIDTSMHISKNGGVVVAQLEYSRIIGMLMYLLTSTRPDLAYAVSRISSDANWISDIKDSRSISGYVFTLGGAAISWKSSKQTVIAKSMMESEFITLDKCREEAEWLCQFVKDIPRWPKLSKDNVADPLTKGLSGELISKSSKGMGLKPLKE
ncbi:retrovirus-related pol polyprotein from transposon TNT 1-94 [Tanacetum coccineum]|uniref:Retrovirus-related pol polyprotein from transposon TNT 1-94 n=1 Tax=Tanacetum coccineum TaxID=301880 RepID=A0ABQ4WTE9_9ASTR